MKVIIDRFEEDIAVVELDGEMLNAPRALFADAGEGDTVELRVIPRCDSDGSQNAESAEETPAAIFAKLRKKRKKHRK